MMGRPRSVVLLSCVLAALILPSSALGSIVPVTVTVTSVTNISAGDALGGLPDFFARVDIDNSGFADSPAVFNTNNLVLPAGWTFTRNVSRSAKSSTPIRIELRDFNGSVLGADLIDIDPATFAAVCPGADPLFGCAILTIGRPAIDNAGIDISLNLRTSAVTPVTAGGDATSLSACTTGTEGEAATLCFAITIGAPVPEVLTVTKRQDTKDGFCTAVDCSLREAIGAADAGDTVVLPDLGGPYQLTFSDWDGFQPPQDPAADEPGHLKITKPNLTIKGAETGVIIEQTLPGRRVFDIHGGASVEMSNLTITGGEAGNTSTALPGHIHGGGIHNHGSATLTNVTVTDNSAPLSSGTTPDAGGGGGFYNAGVAGLVNVTVAGNTSVVRGAGIAGAARTLRNTLIANNSSPDGNCDGPVADDGGNLQYPASNCGATVRIATASPILALPFGGIFELPPGSEAIDGGTGASAPVCPAKDQIGGTRPLDGNGDGVLRCDVGAIEFDPEGIGVIHQPLDSSTGQTGPVTLTFDNVVVAGTTTLTTGGTGAAPPAAYRQGTPVLYYDIATAASFTGGVKVCIDYSGRTFANEPGLKLFHLVGGAWQDTTVSLDTAANGVCGRTTSFSTFAIFGANQAPVASISAPAGGYTVVEGGSVVLLGSGSDADGDSLTYLWSPAAGLDDATLATPTFSPSNQGTATFDLVVSDGDATSAPASVTVNVVNAPPVVGSVVPAAGTLYRVGSPVALAASFTDAGVGDVHTCTVDWDDGTAAASGAVSEAGGSGTCTNSRTFTAAGVYTVDVTIDDGDGGTATASTMVVVYDPNAGFVTGGGWIASPAGAYPSNSGLSGRAEFGFVCRYPKGAAVPSGQTEFQFGAGGLNFHSSAYEWLVVTRGKAQCKGVGTINGAGDYGFLVTVSDGAVAGGDDRFRIKIWNRTNNGVVYNNTLSPTATDDIDRAMPQPIVEGKITIHEGT